MCFFFIIFTCPWVTHGTCSWPEQKCIAQTLRKNEWEMLFTTTTYAVNVICNRLSHESEWVGGCYFHRMRRIMLRQQTYTFPHLHGSAKHQAHATHQTLAPPPKYLPAGTKQGTLAVSKELWLRKFGAVGGIRWVNFRRVDVFFKRSQIVIRFHCFHHETTKQGKNMSLNAPH